MILKNDAEFHSCCDSLLLIQSFPLIWMLNTIKSCGDVWHKLIQQMNLISVRTLCIYSTLFLLFSYWQSNRYFFGTVKFAAPVNDDDHDNDDDDDDDDVDDDK